MRPVDGLEIPAGGTVVLKPGGGHVMISGLTAPLHPGEMLQLTLRFERSGDKPVELKVKPALAGTGH
jgi:copper(I)-binding protein